MKDSKYQKVIDWIRREVECGHLQQGDRLSPEMELGVKFGLSRQTVRHAIDELVKQGMLIRIQGSGTYVGRAPARLRKERYRNVAVISTYIDSYIFPATLRGIEEVLFSEGYMTQIAFTNDSVERERLILDNLILKDNIDGLIVEPSKSALPNPNLNYYKKLADRHIPVLFFNCGYPGLDFPVVSLDDKGVAKKAVKYLIDRGHKKIAGIFKSDDGQGSLRYAGFIEGLQERGLPWIDRHIVWVDSDDFLHMDMMEDYLMYRIDDCTALVCYNDEVAYMMTDICGRRGVEIPDRLSIISIDDSDLASLADIPFTSFPHPKEELGRMAAGNMLKLIDNGGFKAGYLFDAEPVERKSVKIIEY